MKDLCNSPTAHKLAGSLTRASISTPEAAPLVAFFDEWEPRTSKFRFRRHHKRLGRPMNIHVASTDAFFRVSTNADCHPEAAESSATPRTPNEGPMQFAEALLRPRRISPALVECLAE